MLYGIQLTELPDVWPMVSEELSAAASRSRGKFDGRDVLKGLLSQELQLWIWHSPTARGLLVTQIFNYPKNRVCGIRIATGNNAEEWCMPALDVIERWAKASGCNAMELIARPGWKKLIKGYAMTHLYLEKAL